jgi:hypothetical protein
MVTERRYYLPVAAHRAHPERLLLLDQDEQWFLWSGDEVAEHAPLAIEPALGCWMAQRPELVPLSRPLMWFAADDLPVLTGQESVA